MGDFARDLRFGWRLLARNPGVSGAALLTLALGIGATSSMFGVVNAVVLKPLGYPDSARLVLVSERYPPENLDFLPASVPDYLDWRAQKDVFQALGAFREIYFNLTEAGNPERLVGGGVSASLFQVLGVEAMAGRTFVAEEEEPGQEAVVVLSHGLWQRRFGADPSLVGHSIPLNGRPYTVVGIMPPGFEFPPPFSRDGNRYATRQELWVPLAFSPQQKTRRMVHVLRVVARLEDGVSLEQAQAAMDTVVDQISRDNPKEHADVEAQLSTLHRQVTGFVAPNLLLLLAAVALLLLIACANVANLLLSRVATRKPELSTRAALGASRWQIVRQLFAESLILAVGGGLLGIVLAQAVILALPLAAARVPRLEQVSLDARVILVSLAACLATALLFGVAPAWQASRPELQDALRQGARALSAGIGQRRLHAALVVVEVALALTLLVGASLVFRSFLRLSAVNPGFLAENVLAFDLSASVAKYPEERQRAAFYQEVLHRLRQLPGVRTAGATAHLPLGGPRCGHVALIEGRSAEDLKDLPTTGCSVVTPGYFASLGIPVLRGRDLEDRDREDSTRVAVINEVMAARFWSGGDPVGTRLKQGRAEEDAPWLTVVGVVGNVKRSGLGAPVEPEVFLPHLQLPFERIPDPGAMTLVVRAESNPLALMPAVREQILAVDPELPVSNPRSLQKVVAASLSSDRLSLLLLGAFAGLAFLLAAFGVYAVTRYLMAERTQEIGLRLALGATPRRLQAMVVAQRLRLLLIGLGIGVAGALAFGRLLRSSLYGIEATDPLSFLIMLLAFLLVGLVASYLTARRATAIGPSAALRYE
jgi:predicted permease